MTFVRPVDPRRTLPWCRPACLTRARAEANQVGSPVLARIAAAPNTDSPVIAHQRGQAELVHDTDHQRLDLDQALTGAVPVGKEEPHPFQCPASVADHSGRVGQGGEQVACDPQRGLEPASRATSRCTARSTRSAPRRRRVRSRSPPLRLQITVRAASQVRDRNGCPAVSSAAGQPHSGSDHTCWTWPAIATINWSRRAQVPQPSPRLVDGFGHVAEQLRGQPGDAHHVLPVGHVESQLLCAPRPGAEHGWTHTNGMPRSAASCPRTRHRCPVGSHATVTPVNPAEARHAAQSSAVPRVQARQGKTLRANTFEPWPVTTTACLASQVNADDRDTDRHQRAETGQAGVGVAITRGHATTVARERLYSCDGTPSPTAHQEDVPASRPTRRTSVYAAVGAAMPTSSASNRFVPRDLAVGHVGWWRSGWAPPAFRAEVGQIVAHLQR